MITNSPRTKISRLVAVLVLFGTLLPVAQVSTHALSFSTAPVTLGTGQPELAPLHGFRELTVGNYFVCQLPEGWTKDETPFDLQPGEEQIFGITLYGPGSGMVPIKISVLYYAPGNRRYKSLDHFVQSLSQPILGPAEGDSYGPVTETTVSGRKGKVFEQRKHEFVALPDFKEPADNDPRVYENQERMALPVAVFERFVVVSAESGFYALRYAAPAERAAEFLGIFELVTTTFRPGPDR